MIIFSSPLSCLTYVCVGYTPLLHAISIGDHQSLLWLIHRGANVDVRDRDTLSALHVASDGGHLEAAKILIGQGADPTCTTKKGQTPIDIARTEEMKEYLLGQLQVSLCTYLLLFFKI